MTPRQQFLSLEWDEQRWRFLISCDKSLFKIILDNDETYVCFFESEHLEYDPEGEWEEYEWDKFDGWLGNSNGVFILLEVLGINAESV
jgi:hypothetical protein